jgi:hypothetical protein
MIKKENFKRVTIRKNRISGPLEGGLREADLRIVEDALA